MKKRFFVAIAVLATSVVFAQQKKMKQPPPPPPPPVVDVKEVPPPPPPPEPVNPPSKTKMSLSKDYQSFLKRNPDVKEMDLNNNKIHIRLKSGKEEVYDLNNKEEVKKLKDKYGELPAPPPPPPPPTAKGC